MNTNTHPIKRRDFLKGTGCLLIGFSLFPISCTKSKSQIIDTNNTSPSTDPNIIDSWIRLDAKGKLTVLTGKMELGQGIQTALMQMAAEELDIDMERVEIIIADTGQTPDERYTAGSGSIERSGQSIRKAAAEARKILLELASQKLGISQQELFVENGTVQDKNGQKSISYWDLLQGKRLESKVSGNAPLKDPSNYRIVGSDYPRKDISAMVTGQPVYVQDLRLDGMAHARILRPPVYGAKLLDLPKNEVEGLPGVLKVIHSGNFVGVVAKEEYQAIKAWRKLKAETKWKKPPLSPKQGLLFEDMKSNGNEGNTVEEKGEPQTAFSSSQKHHEATYSKPYIMHGSLGPSCALAQWKENELTIWSHTQGVYPLRSTVAHLLNIPEENIRVIGVPGSGCYGHNGADDVGGDAALLAFAIPGIPIRVQWMREDEHQWEPFGSAMLLELKGALDENNQISAYESHLWSDTHSTRPRGDAGYLLSARELAPPFEFSPGSFSGGSYRNAIPLYEFGAQKITLHDYKGPLRTSALRSLGAFANIFALESFMDEMAHLANEDPVDFRLKHLQDERAKEVISALAEKANWKNLALGPGEGKGIAFSKYKNSAAYFAVIAEVLLNTNNQTIQIKKLTGCIDAGQTINKDGLENQTVGGMIQSASWTLLEQVLYSEQGITSMSWDSYPILRFPDIPDTEVIIIDRPKEKPLGAGEAAQGPCSAAIANAVFDGSGSRVRNLPLTPEKINWDL